jgi:hypothetical protein
MFFGDFVFGDFVSVKRSQNPDKADDVLFPQFQSKKKRHSWKKVGDVVEGRSRRQGCQIILGT